MSSPLSVVSEVDHPQNPTTQGDTLSLSLSLCDRRCCVEMHERSDFSSLATCVDMKCSTTRPTTSSYMFSGGKKISFGLLKHETRSANRFASEKGVKNGKVA